MAAESTMKLLWDLANELDSETHAKKLLKSYYITTCRKIAKNNIQVPKEKFAVSQMCPRCSSFWSESEFKLKLKPQQLANCGKAKKLIAKLEEAVTTQKKGLLSKKQRRRAKWLKKRVCSNVEIHCDTCKHKTLIPLQKPDKKLQTLEAAEVTEEAVPEATPKTKKKKNKKKDQMAGLKITPKVKKNADIPSVKLESAKPPKAMQKSLKGLEQTTKSNPFATDATKNSRNNSSSNFGQALKVTPNLSQSLKVKKKKYKSKAKPTTPVVPTVQSKTQQKNSLLQLAALLKKQGTKTNTAQSRLETMLK